MQAFIDRFRAKATKARQAQSRIKALAKLPPLAPLVAEAGVTFDFPEPEQLAPPIVALDRVAVGYEPGRPVLRGLDLRLDMDDRVALLGMNGNGKSTLARLLAGTLSPSAGEVRTAARLQVGYYAQDQAETLDLDQSGYALLAEQAPALNDSQIRAHLGRFGFSGAHAEVKAASLSGGEKARLVLALISRARPHLLVLDEPTNHLDLDAREALVRAINDFAGAVVLITHDARLIELCADRLWLVADGTCRPFDGDLDDYRRLVLERSEQTLARPAGEAARRATRKDQRRAAADLRVQLQPLRQRVRAAENKIERLGRDKTALDARLAEPGLYQGPAALITEITRAQAEIARALAEAEGEWLRAQQELETASAEAEG